MAPPPLLDAARFARLPDLRRLLREGADPDVRFRGYRPLHSLIQERSPGDDGPPSRERIQCFELLLEHGADPDALAAFPPARALLVAAFAGEEAFVSRLRARARSLDVFAAAALAEAATMKRLLARDGALAHARDGGGLTALQCAAASRMGRRDSGAARRLLAIAGQLLDAGADVDARTRSWDDDVHAASLASSSGNRAMLELLLDRGADATAALPPALWNATEDFAELALERGADVDAARHRGRPILNELVRWGRIRPALWLLAHGASPNVPDERGFTALHQAASRGNARMLGALLDAGGDPAMKDARGRTPLDLARAMGRRASIAALTR